MYNNVTHDYNIIVNNVVEYICNNIDCNAFPNIANKIVNNFVLGK